MKLVESERKKNTHTNSSITVIEGHGIHARITV